MRLACVQANVFFSDPQANARQAIAEMTRLKNEGVDLAVFPEAFLTGYCVGCLDDARQIAIPRSHATIKELDQASQELGITAVVGFAEEENGTVFNCAVLLEPGKEPRFYRKCHLPDLGLDKFVKPGDELPVFDTAHGKVGVLICYDLRPPEASRVLALNGADLIVLPTNWPEGAEVSAEHAAIVRSAENHVFFATCNRTGSENGFTFIGRSKIIAPGGKVLATAGSGEETIVADIDLPQARNKRRVNIPGLYEFEIMKSRRPELYGSLTE